MSFPAFTAGRKLADKGATISSLVTAFNSLVSNLESVFTSLTTRVQLDSVLLQGIVLVPGANTISHTLGRTLTGWSIVNANGAAQIYAAQPQSMAVSYLTLVSNARVTVSLLVF